MCMGVRVCVCVCVCVCVLLQHQPPCHRLQQHQLVRLRVLLLVRQCRCMRGVVCARLFARALTGASQCVNAYALLPCVQYSCCWCCCCCCCCSSESIGRCCCCCCTHSRCCCLAASW